MTTNQDREKFDAWWKAHCYDRVVIGKAVAVEIAFDAWQAALQSQQAALVKCVEVLQMFYSSEHTELRGDEYKKVDAVIAEAERVLK